MLSAYFSVGDVSHSIDEVYGPSENIKGWVNISFSDEPTNSLFEDSNENSMSLIGLLEKEGSYSYDCNPLNCQTDYSASAGENTKTFSLDPGESKILGLQFTGNVVGIDSIRFEVESNAPVSCNSQVKIDFTDDGTIESANDKIYTETCSASKSYGCFDDTGNTEEYLITSTPYCQKIELPEAPGFSIGAWIKQGSGSVNLAMGLYETDGWDVASCTLSGISGDGEYSCDVDYLIKEAKDHYVCISSTEGSEDYWIRGNTNPSPSCGFRGIPPSTETASYQIFAQGKKFDAFGISQISNDLDYGSTLGELVQDYLIEKYGDLDCSSTCTVPIRFFSGEDQQISVRNLESRYEKESGIVADDKFYDLIETPATLTSDFHKLYLDKGDFDVPGDTGDYTFTLELDQKDVFSQEVSIQDVPIIDFLSPRITASAVPTEFSVIVDSVRNITLYEWDFGDGSTDTSTKNKITHTYTSTGLYNLTINVTDSSSFSASKTFSINVTSPKEAIRTSLDKMKNDLDNIKTQILNFNIFQQEAINSFLDIETIEITLENIEEDYNQTTLEEGYNSIMTEVLGLKVPEAVVETKDAESISFYPERNDIDLDVLEAISGGSYERDNEEGYLDAVLSWYSTNLETKVDFNEFSLSYGSSAKPALRVFKLEIDEKSDLGYNTYLILPDLENLEFSQGYLTGEEGGYKYIDLRELPTSISFSTTEDVDFSNLPAFIAPGISRLSVSPSEGDVEEEEKRSKWTIFILVIFFLLIIGLITYLIMQEWYKRKYEAYLFKNKNDLYNMANYIHNAKKKGFTNKEIKENLGKAKWTSEQIRYAVRKYAGRRTGMFEIPVTDIVKKIKGKDFQHRRV
jgi:PKD repeat protein